VPFSTAELASAAPVKSDQAFGCGCAVAPSHHSLRRLAQFRLTGF
jgi:hypothetical protein